MLERPIATQTTQRLTRGIVVTGKEVSIVRRTVLGRYLTPFIVGIGIFWITNAEAANELRCIELGSNCIASEPLNTDTFVQDVNAYWNPADTTTKEMSLVGGFPGACIEENGFATGHIAETSGEMFTALPKISPSIKFLLRTANGGGNFLGHSFPASAPTARASMRWYMYFSPTFQFSGGSCLNSGKMFELGETATVLVWSTGGGGHLMYSWGAWNPTPQPFDCCVTGPGGDVPFNAAAMNGKWWRFEIVVRNRLPTGSVTVIQTYRKNVTDDLPEQLILDTSIPTSQAVGNQWDVTQATTLKPLARVDRFAVTDWRDGACSGYHGITHILAAAWDTDAGQRIGAATEIEASTGTATIFPTPGNLRVK